MNLLKATIAIYAVLSSMFSIAQEGNLDSTFDFDGKVITTLGAGASAILNAVLNQPDNKIIVATNSVGPGAASNGFLLLRYKENGSLDSTFSTDGIAQGNFDGNFQSTPMSIALQKNNKIMVAGYIYNSLSDKVIGLARFNTNGTFDNSFSGDGKLLTYVNKPGNNNDDVAKAIVMTSNGKIWLTGESDVNFGNDIVLIRYNSNGSIDTSTDSNAGIIRFENGYRSNGIALQQDEKVLICGSSTANGNPSFLVLRRNSNGSIDSSFNNIGHVIFGFGSGYCEANSIHVQPWDGKILVAGYFSFDPQMFAIARLNIDGTLDNTFDNDGKKTLIVGNKCNATSINTQSDGKILISGTTGSGNTDFTLVRLNQDGSIDNKFGINGIIITDFSNRANQCKGMALQNDGNKIVLAGNLNYDAKDDIAIARYIIGQTVGVIDSKTTQSSILIYPNPVATEFILKYSISNNTNLSVRLYDLKGVFIETLFPKQLQIKGNYQQTFRLSTKVIPGKYFLLFETPLSKTTVMFMKK
ncbi:MAG: T9SS type A sorting domain-containing protein [Saprospiraceae bacterium]|nr:T9SS type A sorting domain-containing protein [Saprospiraceae bacterium]